MDLGRLIAADLMGLVTLNDVAVIVFDEPVIVVPNPRLTFR